MHATSDYLNFTVPKGEGELVQRSVEPLLESMGGYQRYKDLWDVDKGTVKFSTRGFVAITGMSGVVLAKLRAQKLLSQFLHTIAPSNPRVSTLDMFVDVPIAGADIVPALYEKYRVVGLPLTRKASKVEKIIKPGPDGRDTGTLYCGNRRTHDVFAKIYDKQAERIEKGFADPGPLTRYEITVRGDVGASLADVADPTRLFYHFASPALLPRPATVALWEPTEFERDLYEFTQRREVMPYQRMKSLIETSADVARLVKIATSTPGGAAALLTLLRLALERGSVDTTGATAGPGTTSLESGALGGTASPPTCNSTTTH